MGSFDLKSREDAFERPDKECMELLGKPSEVLSQLPSGYQYAGSTGTLDGVPDTWNEYPAVVDDPREPAKGMSFSSRAVETGQGKTAFVPRLRCVLRVAYKGEPYSPIGNNLTGRYVGISIDDVRIHNAMTPDFSAYEPARFLDGGLEMFGEHIDVNDSVLPQTKKAEKTMLDIASQRIKNGKAQFVNHT